MDKLFQNGAFIPCSHKPTWLHQRSHLMSKHFVKSATAKMFENKKKKQRPQEVTAQVKRSELQVLTEGC